MNHGGGKKRVIALDVRSRSFGFAVFEGPDEILDWGVRSFRSGANAVILPPSQRLRALLDEFDPSAIVINRKPKRNASTAKMIRTMTSEADDEGIPVRFVTPEDVKKAFVGFDSNKYEVAAALAKQFPALASRLPPKRKCWQSEDYRMSIFDSAAIGVAHFTGSEQVKIIGGDRLAA